MPLELTAIDPKDPDWNDLSAAIPLQAHEYMMIKAQSNGLQLISRMNEYWEDTLYESDELEHLRFELAQVRNLLSPQEPDAERLSDLIARMDFVVAKAQEIGGYVEAIAD